MRAFILFIPILILSCEKDPEFTLNCIPADLQDGAIAYYPFHNGSLNDASGYGNHLTNPTNAQPANDRFGNTNCAFEFRADQTGPGSFLTTTQTAFLNGREAFSIVIWYMPLDTLRTAGTYELLVGRGSQGYCPDRGGEWSVGLYDCRRAVFGHNNSVWINAIDGAGCNGSMEYFTDQWHHVVATYRSYSYKIYYNGVLHEEETGPAQCTNLHLAQDVGDLFIGRSYTGVIDDILIYTRELNAQEVVELFELGPCCG